MIPTPAQNRKSSLLGNSIDSARGLGHDGVILGKLIGQTVYMQMIAARQLPQFLHSRIDDPYVR
ncbi:hypothetical protein [Planktotalea sp.]|uniref:hypothetical protein n=1 Tax=Planktotalea sp. TaxID=2029877 RepID=UPI0025EEBEFE|nr:hypothetical protein [Planktotalea sp.]